MPIRFWRPVLKHCCDIRLPFKRKRQQSFATMFSLAREAKPAGRAAKPVVFATH
jgi:hypothetical protein